MVLRYLQFLVMIGLVILILGGCVTEDVYYIGHVEENPVAPVIIVLDDTRGVLVIGYKVEIEPYYQEKKSQAMRRIDIPYEKCDRFVWARLEDLTETSLPNKPLPSEVNARLLKKMIQPKKPWVTSDAPLSDVLQLPSLEIETHKVESYGDPRTVTKAELETLKKGNAIFCRFPTLPSVYTFLIPWRDNVLYIPLPERQGHVPWSWAWRYPLYPIAVVIDAGTLPLMVVTGLVSLWFLP